MGKFVSNIRNLAIAAVAITASITMFGAVNQVSACEIGNTCTPVPTWTEQRVVEVGGWLNAGAIQVGEGQHGSPTVGTIVEQYATSDGYTDAGGKIVSDVSTCPGDDCAGLRVELNAMTGGRNISSAYQKVEGGPASVMSNSAVAADLSGFAFVRRGIVYPSGN